MLVCIFGTPFSFAASLYGRWLIGDQGCKWYGFANTLFGIVSLASLAVLSYERYSTILSYTKADPSDYKKAWLAIGGAWLYSLLWTMPPFFGWSSYGPEGPGTICSVQWHQRSSGNISYVTCLFIFCLLLPLLLMVICYGKIIFFIRRVAKTNQLSAHRRETHVLVMVVSMVSCYLLCWMPYGVVALLATFGQVGLVGPTTSIVPSILAKSSTFLNPIIYILLNNQFYRCFLAFMSCGSEPTGSHTLCALPSSRRSLVHSLEHASPWTVVGPHSRSQQREKPDNLVVHYTSLGAGVFLAKSPLTCSQEPRHMVPTLKYDMIRGCLGCCELTVTNYLYFH
uniref:Teleost multiple tissue opsin 3b n=1 Tax=Oncorhynchus mykiss TaxID=8022 RepID=A0A8K9VE92_ONCMY